MFGWIYYFYLNNVYVLNNITKFWTEDLPSIIEDSMIEPDYANLGTSKYSRQENLNAKLEPGAGKYDLTDPDDYIEFIDNIDIDAFFNGLVKSKHIEGVEDDIILFYFFYKLMSLFYETVFIWYFGKTLGKAVMNIEVIFYSSFASGNRNARNGLNLTPDVMVVNTNQSMTLLRSFSRALLKSIYFAFLFPIVFFLMPFSSMGNNIYDKLTKTMVVKGWRNNNNNNRNRVVGFNAR